jgi:2-polyprenyl-3-methyl-5-hydroxy-6-metoxy-1,4-benzoquinol methylase
VPSDFDAKAATWDDDPAKVERARVVAEAVLDAVAVSPETRLLEYGAGTGLVSQSLADHVASVTLAEPSTGMRDVMARKVADGTLPAAARIWDLDLSSSPAPNERFDLVVTVMTLHHIPDVVPVLDGFAALLSDGGHLCIVDLEAEDGSFHSHDADFDGHHGFGRAELAEQLEAAGFTDVAFAHCHEVEKDGGRYPLFLATCSRATGRRA